MLPDVCKAVSGHSSSSQRTSKAAAPRSSLFTHAGCLLTCCWHFRLASPTRSRRTSASHSCAAVGSAPAAPPTAACTACRPSRRAFHSGLASWAAAPSKRCCSSGSRPAREPAGAGPRKLALPGLEPLRATAAMLPLPPSALPPLALPPGAAVLPRRAEGCHLLAGRAPSRGPTPPLAALASLAGGPCELAALLAELPGPLPGMAGPSRAAGPVVLAPGATGPGLMGL